MPRVHAAYLAQLDSLKIGLLELSQHGIGCFCRLPEKDLRQELADLFSELEVGRTLCATGRQERARHIRGYCSYKKELEIQQAALKAELCIGESTTQQLGSLSSILGQYILKKAVPA